MLRRRMLAFRGALCLFGLILCGGAGSATSSAPAASRAPRPDIGELINESGRLRMLSERMGKSYAQIALNVMTEKAQEQITQSEKRFDDNLILLDTGATTPELKTGLDAVSGLYHQYTRALMKPADKVTVAAAHRLTDQLVAEAEKLTAAFAAQAHGSTARIINVSGRERMLSQRIARHYFAAILNGDKADIEKNRTEFKQALITLENAPLSSVEIKREIDLAKTQWLFFESALQSEGDLKNGMKNVATTSERLLEAMDNLTSMYNKALKNVVGLAALVMTA